jgi:hypothetical protein
MHATQEVKAWVLMSVIAWPTGFVGRPEQRFEVWLLLHHADATRAFTNAKAVVRELRKHVKGYDKTRLRFEQDFAAGIDVAVGRGQAITDGGNALGRNPSTSVLRLVQKIVSESPSD